MCVVCFLENVLGGQEGEGIDNRESTVRYSRPRYTSSYENQAFCDFGRSGGASHPCGPNFRTSRDGGVRNDTVNYGERDRDGVPVY